MLRSIHLENFKCFGERVEIPLAPITLLFGKNSSGKSSILQSLYLLLQTRRFGMPETPLLFRAENGLTDLGSFDEVIFNHSSEEKTINIRLDADFWLPEVGDSTRRWFESISPQKVGLLLEFAKNSSGEVLLHAFEAYIDDSPEPLCRYQVCGESKDFKTLLFKCMALSKNCIYWKSAFDSRLEIKKSLEESLARSMQDSNARDSEQESEQEPVEEEGEEDKELQRLLELYQSRTERLAASLHSGMSMESFIEECTRLHYFFSFIPGREYFLPGKVTTLKERIDSTPVEILDAKDIFGKEDDLTLSTTDILEDFGPANIALVCAYIVDAKLSDIVPLGPLRHKPERLYLFSGTTPVGVGSQGEKTIEFLYRHPELLGEVNDWLDRLELGFKLEISTSRLGYSDMFEARLRDLSRPQLGSVGLADVGFGVGQVLPIVVQGIASSNRTILIEQPETHVHPALQADLGRFIAESATKRSNQFIIETHSEHLILRLQRLVRKKVLKPEDLMILYVDKGRPGEPESGAGATVNQIHVDETGAFLDEWPRGFFPERLKELLD